jgi:hypothetical protein
MVVFGMVNQPITTLDWRVFETAGNVPKGADKIDYGLAIVGSGRVWIDSVALEVSE